MLDALIDRTYKKSSAISPCRNATCARNSPSSLPNSLKVREEREAVQFHRRNRLMPHPSSPLLPNLPLPYHVSISYATLDTGID